MMDVRVYHTAEVMVALGSDYFAMVTKDKALEIARLRQNSNCSCDSVILGKISKIKTALTAYDAANKPLPTIPEEQPKKSHEKILLEQNEAGEDVFEIIEYPDQEEEVAETKPTQHKVEEFAEVAYPAQLPPQ